MLRLHQMSYWHAKNEMPLPETPTDLENVSVKVKVLSENLYNILKKHIAICRGTASSWKLYSFLADIFTSIKL